MKKLSSAAALIAIAIIVTTGMFMPRNAVAVGAGNAAEGQKIHKQQCLRCHGPSGKGDGPAAKLLSTKPADWNDKSRMGKLSDADLFNVIKNGGAAAGKSKLMPAFGGKVSDDDIHNVIAFIRSL